MLTSRLFKSTATQFRMITTPSHPSREQLLARIQQLESKFNSLSIPLPPSDLPKKHSQHSNVKGPGLGPLPEVLARAPKRHVAFLFSCT